MTPAIIGQLIENFGLPLALIIILLVAVGYLFRYIADKTVPKSVYNETCETQRKLSEAVNDNTHAVHELVTAHHITNELVRLLVGQGAK